MGGHRHDVAARVGGCGRPRACRWDAVAVRTRRRLRALPDLRQRAVALRAAPAGHRSRLPVHVRRPDAGPEAAALMTHQGATTTTTVPRPTVDAPGWPCCSR